MDHDGEWVRRWERRHRLTIAISVFVALTVAAIALLDVHHDDGLAVAAVATLLGPALAAGSRLRPRVQALTMSATLLTHAVLLISVAGGAVRPHALVLCVICIVAIYEDRLTLVATAVAAVVLSVTITMLTPWSLNLTVMDARSEWGAALLGVAIIGVGAASVSALWSDQHSARERAHRSHQITERFLEMAGSLLLVIDKDGLVATANRQVALTLDREQPDLLGKDWFDLAVPDELREQTRGLFDNAMRTGLLMSDTQSTAYEQEVVAASGERRMVAWYATLNFDEKDRPIGMVLSGNDITDQREAQRKIERAQLELESLRRLMQKIASLDDARKAIVDAAVQLTGAQMVGIAEPTDDARKLTYEAISDDRMSGLSVGIDDGTSRVAEVYRTGHPYFCRNATTDPRINPALLQATEMVGILHEPIVSGKGLLGVLTVAWDHEIKSPQAREVELVRLVAQEAAIALRRRESVAALARAALVDPLTGIANRRAYDAELPVALRRAGERDEPLAVVVMDLNGFKAVNDTIGHEAGDELLVRCATAWSDSLRQGDVIARLGGDEFSVILPGCDHATAEELRERLRNATPHEPGTAIGVAVWDGTESSADLIRRADAAQYADKAACKAARAAADAPSGGHETP